MVVDLYGIVFKAVGEKDAVGYQMRVMEKVLVGFYDSLVDRGL